METGHSSLHDTRVYLSSILADKATDVYSITGERSQLSRSILRLPQLQRLVLSPEVTKLDRMKKRYEERAKKVANSFLCSQTTKALHWQHADVHWAAATSARMTCYRNSSFSPDEKKKRKEGKLPVLYRSADYSAFGDKTYYRLIRGDADLTKPPPVAGLLSGPRLEFLRVGGHTCFNKVTHTTTADVVSSYKDSLNSRNRLLLRTSMTR